MYRLTKRKGRKVQVSYKTDKGWTPWASTGCDTIAEARLKLKDKKPTFGEYARDFYTRTDTNSYIYRKKVRSKSVTENTLYQKDLILKGYLIPEFGKMRIDKIKACVIEAWFTNGKGIRQKRISGARSNVVLSVLREVLQFAVIDGIIDSNEAKKVEVMDDTHHPRRPITPDEMKTLFPDDDDLLQQIWGEFTPYFLIFLDTGFRPCEIVALRYDNIHEDSVYTESMYDSFTKTIKHRIKTIKTGKKYKVGTLSERTLKFLGKGIGQIFDTKVVNTKSAWRKFHIVAESLINRTDVTQYQLRSAFMTNRIMSKYPKELIMELMGHTTWESCYDVRTPEQIIENLRTALSRYQA